MAKKSDDVECIVLKIGDKELNGENDPKIMDKYGSFIYFPYDSIDEEDLAELAKGSVITVSVKLVGVRKKVPLICHVEEIDKTMATPGIIIDSIPVGESSNVSSDTTEDLIEKPKRGRKKKNLNTQTPSTLSETVVARSSNENVEKSDSTLSLNELLLSNVSDKIDGMSECLSEIRDNTKSIKELLQELVIIMRPKDTQKTRRIIFDSKMTPNQKEDQIENDEQETLDQTVENQKNSEEDNEKIDPSLDEGADSKPSSSKKGRGSEFNNEYYKQMEKYLSKIELNMEYNFLSKTVPRKIEIIENEMRRFVNGNEEEFYDKKQKFLTARRKKKSISLLTPTLKK